MSCNHRRLRLLPHRRILRLKCLDCGMMGVSLYSPVRALILARQELDRRTRGGRWA